MANSDPMSRKMVLVRVPRSERKWVRAPSTLVCAFYPRFNSAYSLLGWVFHSYCTWNLVRILRQLLAARAGIVDLSNY